jgi:putative Mn2+ efflux pump MntP
MIALILSLGIDTLMVAISLGAAQIRGKLPIALTFALAEGVMPLIGLLAGRAVGRILGNGTAWLAGLILMGLAVWLIFFDRDDDRIGSDRRLTGWPLVAAAFGISLDEWAVGFSVGLVGVPVLLTAGFLMVQAFLWTVLGMTFGSRLAPHIGEWTERLPGLVLGFLGIWILVQAVGALSG